MKKLSSWTALIKKVKHSLQKWQILKPQENVVYLTYLVVGEQGGAKGIGSFELLHDHPGADDDSRTTIFLVVVVKMDDRAVLRNNRLVFSIVR